MLSCGEHPIETAPRTGEVVWVGWRGAPHRLRALFGGEGWVALLPDPANRFQVNAQPMADTPDVWFPDLI